MKTKKYRVKLLLSHSIFFLVWEMIWGILLHVTGAKDSWLEWMIFMTFIQPVFDFLLFSSSDFLYRWEKEDDQLWLESLSSEERQRVVETRNFGFPVGEGSRVRGGLYGWKSHWGG